MQQEPVNPVKPVNPVTSPESIVIDRAYAGPRSRSLDTPVIYPDPREGPLASQIHPRDHRPPPPARVLPEQTPPLEVIIPEGRAYSIRPGPAPGEFCLAIIIFAAVIGFVLFILWILSFSRE